MLSRIVLCAFAVVIVLCGFVEASQEQKKDGKKKQSGTLIGELKSQKPTPNGKNVFIEVLAPGEEKARKYHVQYDQKVKGPIPAVLEAVRTAKVGNRVQIEWLDTGEGYAIKSFEVLKKAEK